MIKSKCAIVGFIALSIGLAEHTFGQELQNAALAHSAVPQDQRSGTETSTATPGAARYLWSSNTGLPYLEATLGEQHPELSPSAGDTPWEAESRAQALVLLATKLIDRAKPAAAGSALRLALECDPNCEAAGRLLAYRLGPFGWEHPRAIAQRAKGLGNSQFGWYPSAIAAELDAGGLHWEKDLRGLSRFNPRDENWPERNVLRYTMIELESSLPVETASALALKLDRYLERVRARLILSGSFREPSLPLRLRIYRNAAECSAAGDKLPPASTSRSAGNHQSSNHQSIRAEEAGLRSDVSKSQAVEPLAINAWNDCGIFLEGDASEEWVASLLETVGREYVRRAAASAQSFLPNPTVQSSGR